MRKFEKKKKIIMFQRNLSPDCKNTNIKINPQDLFMNEKLWKLICSCKIYSLLQKWQQDV